MDNDEYLDLVDSADNVIEKKLRSEVYEEGLSNFRVVNLLVVNSKGELWIPRRTESKKLFPLHLDLSAAGHVESGEDYVTAFERETMEEISIDVNQIGYTDLGKLTPSQYGVSAFMHLYKIELDEVPDYNRSDFCEYFWLTPEELLDKIEGGEKAKSDLPKLVKYFLST